MHRSHLLAALALACLALALPIAHGGAVSPVRAMGALPACRYDDILTSPRRYVDWQETLVDPILRVPSTYAPPDLVSTGTAGIPGGGTIRAIVIDDLRAMADAARTAGAPIAVASAYRSYATQKITFQGWVNALGYARALKVSARPGHSEHQLGLAIDFKSEPGGAPWNGVDWATTPAGAWMKANAWQYGWVISYPKNKLSTVCYAYEPWHYRYVGRELATRIHDSGLTTRAFLWANFTTAYVGPPATGSPQPSKPPVSPPPPSATPTASVAPSILPGPTETAFPAPTESPAVTPVPVASPVLAPTPAGFTDSTTTVAVVVVGIGLIVLIGGGLLLSARRRGPG
jgi:D-alanyl-D-alanine carboxypeptidase